MEKPVVELSECILCGVCESVCPEVFMITDMGYVEVADLEHYPVACVDEAVATCPKDCIFWESP